MQDKLTKKEQTIMKLLMHAEKSLTASQILAQDSELNINTVQGVLRALLKKGFVEVAEIVYSGTVLCRSYRPTEKSKDIVFQEFSSDFKSLRKNIPLSQLIANLIDAEEDKEAVIAELEAIIAERKASYAQEKRKEEK